MYYILCFVDNIKLFLLVRSIDNFTGVQADLNCFSDWFSVLSLSLNLSKCKVMTFPRTHSLFVFSYYLNGTVIFYVVDCFMDLDFKLHISYNLDLCPYIEYIYCKVLKI